MVLLGLYVGGSISLPWTKNDLNEKKVARRRLGVSVPIAAAFAIYLFNSSPDNWASPWSDFYIVGTTLTALALYGTVNGFWEFMFLQQRNCDEHGTCTRWSTFWGHCGAAVRRNGAGLLLTWWLFQIPGFTRLPSPPVAALVILAVAFSVLHLREGRKQAQTSSIAFQLAEARRHLVLSARRATARELGDLAAAVNAHEPGLQAAERLAQMSPARAWAHTDGFFVGARILCPVLLAAGIIGLDFF